MEAPGRATNDDLHAAAVALLAAESRLLNMAAEREISLARWQVLQTELRLASDPAVRGMAERVARLRRIGTSDRNPANHRSAPTTVNTP